MTIKYNWTHGVATAIAAFCVTYRTAVILELFPDASTTMQLGIPLATIAAAMLPVLAEASWRAGERAKAVFIALPVLALVAYELPTEVSRFGEAQEARIAGAAVSQSVSSSVGATHAATLAMVQASLKAQQAACKDGITKDCKAKTETLKQQTATLNSLSGMIKPVAVTPWMPSWHPALLPVGLWLATLAGLFYGMGPLTHPRTVQALTFERDLTPAEIAEIKRIQRLTPENVKTLKGLGMKQHEIAAHFGLNQGRISEMMAGKREAITLH